MSDDLYHVTWQEFHRDTLALAKQLQHRAFTGIIAITRGGMVPAAILARELNIRLVDTICISSYEHDQQGELNILKDVDGNGETMLLVDDLVDTGKTAQAVVTRLPQAHFVTVYAKAQGKPFVHQYQREIAQETWIHFPWDCQLQYREPLR